MDKPLVVAGGCGAGFFDEIVLRQAEQGIHENAAVGDGFAANVFVDAPGSGDHADVLLVRHVDGQSAGVDIKHTADDGSALC